MAETNQDPGSVEPVETTPLLRVVKGNPTTEELAALVTVLASLALPEAPATRRTSDWSAPRGLHRVVHPHGAGGWRSSRLPR
ncbi:MAG: acyl-CoA carboxylase subunit epsilon [Nocardioides sp.]|nr:acyl-CoA carboxylase subunit epsilon [Nocardioides sp.]